MLLQAQEAAQLIYESYIDCTVAAGLWSLLS